MDITLWAQEIGGEYGNRLTSAIYFTVISESLAMAQQKGMYYRKGGQGRWNITLWAQEIGGEYGNRLTLAIYFMAILESLAMEVVIRQDPE